MLKYLTKISMDIFPSVLATIIGAYIVNHYINAKPAPDAPAAAVAPAQPGKTPTASFANLPLPGVKAKGIPEKTVTGKPAAEKAVDQPAETKAAEKSAEPKSEAKAAESKAGETKSTESRSAEIKPAEAAPAETAAPRGRLSAGHEKAIAKANPAPAAESNPAPAATAQDAADLARAAIERLRKEASAQEPARAAEGYHAHEAPRMTAAPSAAQPLPPPITVSTPRAEAYGASPGTPPYASSAEGDDPNRLTPPADIPVPMIAPPLDLRADATGATPRAKTNVADDVLSAAKSMFHAVLPKSATPD